MRATELSRRMARLVRAWERSGEPRRAFARRHGLTVSQFDYWKRRVRRAAVAPTFVPVQVLPESPAPQASAGAAIELALPGGADLCDYWLIPARVALGNIEWARGDAASPEYEPPRGIQHHYAPLGFVAWRNQSLRIVGCGCTFEPLSSCFHLGSMAVGAHLLRTRIERPTPAPARAGPVAPPRPKRTRTSRRSTPSR